MNILCITHVDFEGPGILQDWAKSKGFGFKIIRPYQGQDCLSDLDFDLLILMGGPQSVIDLIDYPYLIEEAALIQKAFFNQKRILGFCLGAQLIGAALGAEGEKSPFKEIGVFPIHLNEEGLKDPFLKKFPANLPVVHWHNDMPGLTEEAIVLASSDGCPRQIIRYNSKIYGFQCHPEMTYRGIKDLIKNCALDLKTEGMYIQDATTFLNHDFIEMNNALMRFLDLFMDF